MFKIYSTYISKYIINLFFKKVNLLVYDIVEHTGHDVEKMKQEGGSFDLVVDKVINIRMY